MLPTIHFIQESILFAVDTKIGKDILVTVP